MNDLFEIRLIMEAELLEVFGDGVAAVCVRLPEYLEGQIAELKAHLARS